LHRRLPKRGFRNPLAGVVVTVNVGDLEAFAAGTEITAAKLMDARLIRGQYDTLKVLGDGELTKKLVVQGHRFSASARAKIEKAGGSVVVLAAFQPKAS
jgi:large subunit ribosomal protein L15